VIHEKKPYTTACTQSENGSGLTRKPTNRSNEAVVAESGHNDAMEADHRHLLGFVRLGRRFGWRPPILELSGAKLLERDKPWHAERLPLVQDRVRDRLKRLSTRLGNGDWLDGAFSAGDLMMVLVLLRLRPSGLLDEYSNLTAYVARGEGRPAYKRAFDAQSALYTGKPSTG
jgi:glutathione S-transferase